MTVKIDGTNTEANPAFTGADTDTGLQAGTNELKLVTGGTARATVDSSGNLGVGTASPNHRLTLHKSGTSTFDALNITSGLTNSVGLQLGIDSASNAFFWHTANGGIKFATNNVERMRVTNNGITFNGDTAAVNALDDYEEGDWTPTSGDNFGAFSNPDGSYIKIGHLVMANFIFNTASSSSTDNCKIGGLPYPVKDTISGSSVEYTGVCFHEVRMFLTFPQGGTSNIVVETDRPIEGSATTGALFLRGSVVYQTT